MAKLVYTNQGICETFVIFKPRNGIKLKYSKSYPLEPSGKNGQKRCLRVVKTLAVLLKWNAVNVCLCYFNITLPAKEKTLGSVLSILYERRRVSQI